MGVMDEKVPGGVNPVPVPGQVPQGLAGLLQLMFGRQNPVPQTGGGGGGTPAIVGGAPPSLAPAAPGAPSSAGGGVPAAPMNMAIPNPTREMPSAPNIASNFPNKSARTGAVASAGIENFASAIHTFKAKHDDDELAKAKNTMDIYQRASQIDPETGQPVDPYTKHMFENDPKIVKRWEKYLKMEFPRQQADPGAKGKDGKPAQGIPIIPTNQPAPDEILKQLIAKKMADQVRSGALSAGQAQANVASGGESTAMSPEEWKLATKVKYGSVPAPLNQKAIDKIDAEIGEYNAQIAEHTATKNKLEQELADMTKTSSLGGKKDPQVTLHEAQIKAELALVKERLSTAAKNLREASQAKSLQEFTTARTSLNTAITDVEGQLKKAQKKSMDTRSKFGKMMGSDPDPSLEEDALSTRAEAMARVRSTYDNMQDDVVAHKITPMDAMTKARRSANLTSDYEIWNGMPSDAPDPKQLPDGAKWKSPDGVVLGVTEKGKWVAP